MRVAIPSSAFDEETVDVAAVFRGPREIEVFRAFRDDFEREGECVYWDLFLLGEGGKGVR